jgi:hypothetical protein
MVATPKTQIQVHLGGGWLHHPVIDLVILAGPWLFAAAMVSSGLSPMSQPGLALWLAQFVLGNTTHVILTFLLLAFRQDVLRATPSQPRIVFIGSVATFILSWALFRGVEAAAPDWTGFPIAVAAIFGTHHRLSQAKGVWSLYNLRASRLAFPPPSGRERSLQQSWVSVGLVLLMVSWLFVPSGPGRMFPVFQAIPNEPAMLPYEVDYALAAVWGAFVLALLVELARAEVRNVPKMLHVVTHGAAVALAILSPVWGTIVWGAIHGLEYYFLCARMMEPREGDQFAPRGSFLAGPLMIRVLMILSMAPLALVGLAQAPFMKVFSPGSQFAHEGLTVLNAVVMAHYFADAFIYRFRIPEVRKVALTRLGFA